MSQTARTIGPYSRAKTLSKLDGRRWEARELRRVRDELASHVGGEPSATQRALINRAAWLTLHVSLFDKRAMDRGGAMDERDSREYLAFSNSLSRVLKQLGMKGQTAKPVSFRERLMQHAPAPPA